MPVRTRQSHDGWNITEKVMDHIGSTYRETECIPNMEGGFQEATNIAAMIRCAHTHSVMVVV